MTGQTFLFQLLNGLSFAALLFFLASGFTLIFGLMRIVNLAHGGFYLVGGYVGLTVATATGNFWLGLLAAPLAIAAIGLFTERVLLRRIRGQELPEVLLTVGIAFVFADMSLEIWGGDPRSVPIPGFLRGGLDIGFMVYPRYRFFVIGCAVLVGVALFLAHSKTRIGAIVRAGVDDREMVSALGININKIFTGVFIVGALLAGVAGLIGGGLLSLVPGADTEILLYSLAVVIIGGLGSLPGAVVGSLIVGLADAFGRALLPDLSYFTLFAPMALILVVRPRGLLGRQ
ncbi:MAG: branched-chain amino acid ABC transporter permease [Nitriliruptorales bacterium]|nr:branched-chain amino acid ABC transporter permease [Nitriliruptorales bacterium]